MRRVRGIRRTVRGIRRIVRREMCQDKLGYGGKAQVGTVCIQVVLIEDRYSHGCLVGSVVAVAEARLRGPSHLRSRAAFSARSTGIP